MPEGGNGIIIMSYSLYLCRWNSQYKLVVSIVGLKPALVETMSNVEGVPVYFRYQDWELMKKVVKVLEIFVDATDMLSSHDASISMVIPFVTSTIVDLETEDPSQEHGVLTIKRSLTTAMKARFADIETMEHYIVATLLDSKYKGHFYRTDGTLEKAKTILTDRLVELLQDDSAVEVKFIFQLPVASRPSQTKYIWLGLVLVPLDH